MTGVGQGKLDEQLSTGSEELLGPLNISLLSARLSVQLASSFSQPFDVSSWEEGACQRAEHLGGEWGLRQGHGCLCVGPAPTDQSRKTEGVC